MSFGLAGEPKDLGRHGTHRHGMHIDSDDDVSGRPRRTGLCIPGVGRRVAARARTARRPVRRGTVSREMDDEASHYLTADLTVDLTADLTVDLTADLTVDLTAT